MFIHPCDIKTGLLATLLHDVSDDGMSIRELITRLDKSGSQYAITAIAQINSKKS